MVQSYWGDKTEEMLPPSCSRLMTSCQPKQSNLTGAQRLLFRLHSHLFRFQTAAFAMPSLLNGTPISPRFCHDCPTSNACRSKRNLSFFWANHALRLQRLHQNKNQLFCSMTLICLCLSSAFNYWLVKPPITEVGQQ